jgi:hypothetical protein
MDNTQSSSSNNNARMQRAISQSLKQLSQSQVREAVQVSKAIEQSLKANEQNTNSELMQRAIAQSLKNATNTNARVIDVPGDGNCFYYALYGAAKHHGLLQIVCGALGDFYDSIKCINDNIKQRSLFVTYVRKYLSSLIRKAYPCRAMAEMKKQLGEIYKGASKDDWTELQKCLQDDYGAIVDAVPLINDRNNSAFRESVSKIIQTNGTWVTQIEIEIIRKALDKLGILLEILEGSTSLLASSPWRRCVSDATARILYVMYLVRVNRNHYRYVAYGNDPVSSQMDFSEFQGQCARQGGGGGIKAMDRIRARQAELMRTTKRVGDPSEDASMRRMRPVLSVINALGLITIDSQMGSKRDKQWQRAYVWALATRKTAAKLTASLMTVDSALVLTFPHGESAPSKIAEYALTNMPRIALTLDSHNNAVTRQPLGASATFSEMWAGLLPELHAELKRDMTPEQLRALRTRCMRDSVQVFVVDTVWGRPTWLFDTLVKHLKHLSAL